MSSADSKASGPVRNPAQTPPAASRPFTVEVGAFEVSVISDGHLLLPTGLLAPEAPAPEREAVLAAGGSDGTEYQPAANVTLVRSGPDLILFDTGGVGFQPDVGKLSQNLAAAGVEASSITKVVFTHGHPDHIGGTVLDDGTLRFPNAAYYAGQTEWEFWNGEDVWTKLPPDQHAFAVGARRLYAAVRDRLSMFRAGDEVAPGIMAFDTPGHTPGHTSFQLSGGDGLIIVGDVVTAPWVYFPHPEWSFGFDSDIDRAIASRKTLLDRAAADRMMLLGYHWPYPGVGYAERRSFGYVYRSLE